MHRKFVNEGYVEDALLQLARQRGEARVNINFGGFGGVVVDRGDSVDLFLPVFVPLTLIVERRKGGGRV